MTKKKDKPETGKIYSLTGAPGVKCIANGNSWKESEFHESLKEDPLLLAEQRMLLNEQMDDS
ncbi:hypothetical protein N9503_02430 [Candidatus Pelagibacter sp.]|nr:hypothetical protein [Candidatus Pelagibacter sp.]